MEMVQTPHLEHNAPSPALSRLRREVKHNLELTEVETTVSTKHSRPNQLVRACFQLRHIHSIQEWKEEYPEGSFVEYILHICPEKVLLNADGSVAWMAENVKNGKCRRAFEELLAWWDDEEEGLMDQIEHEELVGRVDGGGEVQLWRGGCGSLWGPKRPWCRWRKGWQARASSSQQPRPAPPPLALGPGARAGARDRDRGRGTRVRQRGRLTHLGAWSRPWWCSMSWGTLTVC